MPSPIAETVATNRTWNFPLIRQTSASTISYGPATHTAIAQKFAMTNSYGSFHSYASLCARSKQQYAMTDVRLGTDQTSAMTLEYGSNLLSRTTIYVNNDAKLRFFHSHSSLCARPKRQYTTTVAHLGTDRTTTMTLVYGSRLLSRTMRFVHNDAKLRIYRSYPPLYACPQRKIYYDRCAS